jgi:hypothetical protein
MLESFVEFRSSLSNCDGTQVKPTLGQGKQLILIRSEAHRRGATRLFRRRPRVQWTPSIIARGGTKSDLTRATVDPIASHSTNEFIHL